MSKDMEELRAAVAPVVADFDEPFGQGSWLTWRAKIERAAMRAVAQARVDVLRPQPCWEAINPYVECKDDCQRCKALAEAEALLALLGEA